MPSKTQIVILVANCDPYRDRLQPIIDFCARQNTDVHIITQSLPKTISWRDFSCTIHTPSKTLRGWNFFLWSGRKTSDIANNFAGKSVTLEIATGLSTIIAKTIFRIKGPAYQFVVTPSRYIFWNVMWNKDPNAPKLSWNQHFFWFSTSLLDLMVTKLSCHLGINIIVNSQALLEDVIRLKPKGNSFVVKNAVPYKKTLPGNPPPTRQQYTIISNIQPYKGIGTLLRGISLYKSNGGKCSFLIAGRVSKLDIKWFERTYCRYNIDSDTLIHAPHLSRPDLLQQVLESTAILHASLVEGSPRALIESAAAGRKVIAAAIPPILELQKEFPSCFTTYSPGNAEELANVLFEHEAQDSILSESEYCKFLEDRSPERYAHTITNILNLS